jgi:transcriptional regulator with XRE-family HTH domain
MAKAKKRRAHPPTWIIDELREAMIKSKLTQYRIAKDTGVRQPVLSRFLTGQRGVSFTTAARLCEYLKLHLMPIRE